MNILFIDSEVTNALVFKTIFVPTETSSIFQGGSITCVRDESYIKTPLAYFDLIVSQKGGDSALYHKYRQIKPDNPFILFLEDHDYPKTQDPRLYVCLNKSWKQLKEVFKVIEKDLSTA